MSDETVFTTRKSGDVLVVRVHLKSFDLRRSREFRQGAEQAIGNEKKVVLDLAEVEFMDSSALGTLLPLMRRVTDNEGDLRIGGLQSRVQVLFELTRLYRVFSIWPDADAAVASFAA